MSLRTSTPLLTPRAVIGNAVVHAPHVRSHRRVVSDPTGARCSSLWSCYAADVLRTPRIMVQQPFSPNPNLDVVQAANGSVPSTPALTPMPVLVESALSVITTAVGTDVPSSPKKSSEKPKEDLIEGITCDSAIPEMTLVEAELELREELGHGNQSSVHSALRIDKGEFSCVKRFSKSDMTAITLEFMKAEHRVMQEVARHPCIPEAFRIFQDTSFFYIELALYTGGDFTELKPNALRSGLNCNHTWWVGVFQQALQGLSHLHEYGFMHCDIKEPNLMLKTDNYHEPEVVLIDFGVVQAADAEPSAIYGTPGYIAPEVWDTKLWTPQGDAFSLGVVILQMISDKVPDSTRRCGIFTESTTTFRDVREATKIREPDMTLMAACGTCLQQLTARLLVKDPARRPSPAEALLILESDFEWESILGTNLESTRLETKKELASSLRKFILGNSESRSDSEPEENLSQQ